MARRKGMMVGKGKKGYHNVIPKDKVVHSQSARGMKQPQRIPIPLIKKDVRGKIFIEQPQRIPIPLIKKDVRGKIFIEQPQRMTLEEFNNSDFRMEINRYTNDVSGFSFNNDFFARWWFEAFPFNRDTNYMAEWVERFRKGTPTIFMDKKRRKAYFKVAEEW